jgi:hypothetical protein
VQLQSQLTGKFCRLADLPSGLVSPPACGTQGLICDAVSLMTATVLTFTGTGLAYNSVSLAAVPPSNTLALSWDPSCASPGSSQLVFPQAVAGKPRAPQLRLLLLRACVAQQVTPPPTHPPTHPPTTPHHHTHPPAPP